MIIERRKRIRIPNSADLDLVVEFNFCELDNWADDEPLNEVTPVSILLTFALVTGFCAYAIGSYLFY